MSRVTKLLLLLLLLIAAALPAGWYGAAALLGHSFDSWVENRRDNGFAIRHGEPELAGFPFGLDVSIAEPSIESPKGWRWAGPVLSGRSQVWEPLSIAVESPGRHDVTWGGPEAPLNLQLDATTAAGEIELSLDGKLEKADAALTKVRAEGPLPGAVQIETLDLAYRTPANGSPEPGDLLLTASEVELPAGIDPPLGPKIQRLAVEGAVTGPLPDNASRQSLALWRDAGGFLDVQRFEILWGPLAMEAEGRLALDEELRPIGTLNASLRNGSAVIDILVEKRMIAERAAGALKLAIFALSKDAGDGGPPLVELPVNLREGLLYLGPVALFRLRPIR